ncbi:MAG: hypothetical protein ABIJ34_01395 [archaeon]
MAAAAVQTGLVILPALLMGAVIGLIEMFFVHSDEIGMGWFTHGLHAFPFAMLFTFLSMNVPFVLRFLPKMTETFWVDIGIRVAIAIISMLKISAAAAIAGRVGERFHHTIMVGCLVFAAPYVWMVIGPFIPLPKF